MKLGEILKQARDSKNLSLREVEQVVGISNAYLSQLENGRINKPSPFFLHKLAKAYDLNYGELMMAAKYIDSTVTSVKCPVCGHYVEVK